MDSFKPTKRELFVDLEQQIVASLNNSLSIIKEHCQSTLTDDLKEVVHNHKIYSKFFDKCNSKLTQIARLVTDLNFYAHSFVPSKSKKLKFSTNFRKSKGVASKQSESLTKFSTANKIGSILYKLDKSASGDSKSRELASSKQKQHDKELINELKALNLTGKENQVEQQEAAKTKISVKKAADSKSSTEKAADTKSSAEKAAETKSSAEKAAQTKSSAVKAAETKNSTVKAAETKASVKKADEMKSSAVKAAETKSSVIKAAETKSSTEKAVKTEKSLDKLIKQQSLMEDTFIFKIIVPRACRGLIIGMYGDTVRKIKYISKAMSIRYLDNTDRFAKESVVEISGKLENCGRAVFEILQIVESFFRSSPLKERLDFANDFDGHSYQIGVWSSILKLLVAESSVPFVIGRRGSNLKHVEEETMTMVSVIKATCNQLKLRGVEGNDSVVTIGGSMGGCCEAAEMIMHKIRKSEKLSLNTKKGD